MLQTPVWFGALAFYRDISSPKLTPGSSWGVARLKSFAAGSHWLPTVRILGGETNILIRRTAYMLL